MQMKTTWMLLLMTLVCVTGCGRVKDKATKATNKAGKLVGEGASTFITGVGEGIDKTITTYDVRLSDELKAAGVSTTIAKRVEGTADGSGERALSIYVQNQGPLTGNLRIRLYNENNQEIGRSTAAITFAKDDARYVSFVLDKEIPLTMTKYLKMDLKED